MTSTRSLHRDEAAARAALLEVDSYDIELDLAGDERTFGSVTTIRVTSAGGPTFLDLHPERVRMISLDGRTLDAATLDRGRLPLDLSPGTHEIVVDAIMRFRNDGEGLHRSVDPADGRHYVYGMAFMDAAPSIFACFDQPDLKAPYTLHVRVPADWTVIGNSPGVQTEPGVWELATTAPLSTYLVTLVAGPYHVLHSEHDGIPLGLSARGSLAADLEADADELFTITAQCFDELHRLFGIRYQFGAYHQAFVPEFNAGAMENPGCVTFRDPLVFSSRVTRGQRITRAVTIAHEMAHQWFGNLTTPVWWDDLWLNESFAEYMGVRVTAAVTEYTDAWVNHAHSRRQWGLVADRRPSTHPVAGNGAADARTALQDFDGISYSKGSALLKQLHAQLGEEVFLAGVADHFRSHWFGNATMGDLLASWERAGAVDLSDFGSGWLGTAGVDLLALDRPGRLIRRTPPPAHPARRRHRFRVAAAQPGGSWTVDEVELGPDDDAAYSVAGDAAVLLDPFEDTWAVPHLDDETVAALPLLLPATEDPSLRAGIWNALAGMFHDAALAPERWVDVAEAALPTEASDDAFFYAVRQLTDRVCALAADPDDLRARLHAATLRRLDTAPPGSPVQLAAFQTAVRTSPGGTELAGWLDAVDLPPGLRLDLDLRWHLLVRLAMLGQTDRGELRRHLDAEPTAVSRVAHVRAVASLPEAEAKSFAWRHFTGETQAPNYDIEAAGLGLWRPGQESLTEPYVDRYFDELPETARVRSGWVLSDAADVFFPLTAVAPATLERARALLADETLDRSLHRVLVDRTDELARRWAVRQRFASP